MNSEEVEKILQNATFQLMARKKARLGWLFTFLMLAIYFIYILLIGVEPDLFGIPIVSGGYTTWGIAFGVFVILFAIAITGIYVYKANGEFDRLTQEAIRESGVQR